MTETNRTPGELRALETLERVASLLSPLIAEYDSAPVEGEPLPGFQLVRVLDLLHTATRVWTYDPTLHLSSFERTALINNLEFAVDVVPSA